MDPRLLTVEVVSNYGIWLFVCLCQRTHATVPALGVGIVADNAGVAPLQVLWARRLNRDHVGLRSEAGGAIEVGSLGRAGLGIGLLVHDEMRR